MGNGWHSFLVKAWGKGERGRESEGERETERERQREGERGKQRGEDKAQISEAPCSPSLRT